MNDYHQYEVNDFICDDFFITWVREQTPESNNFWEQWLHEHPEQQRTIEIARTLVASIQIGHAKNTLSNEETAMMSATIATRTSETTTTRSGHLFQKSWMKTAAVFILVTSAALLIYIIRSETNLGVYQQVAKGNNINQAINHTDSPKMVRLTDGSLAILQPGSSLTYPTLFDEKQRLVQLSGEAYFEIAHNLKKPFLVQTRQITTKVLGTSFTVEAFDDDEYAKVAVATGKVSVTINSDSQQSKAMSLLPNEELTYQQHNTSFKKKRLHSPLPLSTPVIQKSFSFHDVPLAEIIEKLQMAYGVEIRYDKQLYGSIKLTASLSDRPLDEKVKLICKAINANCSFPDGMIIIEKEH